MRTLLLTIMPVAVLILLNSCISSSQDYYDLNHKKDPIIVEKGLSIVALIGDNMKNHQGISGKMFSALGKNNINIRAIAQGASEKNISTVIAQKDVKKALNTIKVSESVKVKLDLNGTKTTLLEIVYKIKEVIN